jgi:hypothetical protein
MFSTYKEGNPAICDNIKCLRMTNTAWPHLYIESKEDELIHKRNRKVVLGNWGGRNGGILVKSYKILVIW